MSHLSIFVAIILMLFSGGAMAAPLCEFFPPESEESVPFNSIERGTESHEEMGFVIERLEVGGTRLDLAEAEDVATLLVIEDSETTLSTSWSLESGGFLHQILSFGEVVCGDTAE